MVAEQKQKTHGSTEASRAVRIFYDGACPLCLKEIAHYRRLPGAERLAWIDISRDQAALDEHELSRADAMARMHVLDAAGQWQTGAWAFAEMWSHLPRYKWVALVLRKTATLPLVDRAYGVFARWRLRRRCESEHCSVNPSSVHTSGTGRDAGIKGEVS